jgi:class 3 adenylate cyclase/tetratricopeptide (TPR) repeat protein
MKCPDCQFNNPEGMNFCGKCGRILPVRCPECGHENPPDFEMCGRCGNILVSEMDLPGYARRTPRDYTPSFLAEKVLKIRSSLEGERKLVSVLFADVVGFTSIAENLDPEDVHEIMDGCFEILGQEIHGAGGTINQYTGDGVMALFGAPVSYEDHVKRACHAALKIQDRLNGYAGKMAERYDINFRIRIGIHTGNVVVGAIGDNLRLDYTAVGDTTNLAARLQSLAPPGGILVSERVRDGAKDSFAFNEVGRLAIRGKREKVHAFTLAREFEVESSEGLHGKTDIPFVNREEEVAILRRSFKETLKGVPKLVAVTGEPGIGKTRLLSTFRQSIEKDSTYFLEGQCRPFGEAVAFHPLTWMFKSYFNLSGFDQTPEQWVEIRKRIKEKALYSPLKKVFELVQQFRAEGPGSDIVVQGKKQLLFRSLRDLLLSISAVRPIIMVLDDMQWVDSTTREFLEFLIASQVSAPILLICSGRSEPGPWCPIGNEYLVRLRSLSQDQSSRIFSFVLGTDRLDPAITNEIISKAGGNPLFLGELAETLKRQEMLICGSLKCTLSQPVSEMRIPHNIHGVLAAHLDTLPDPHKSLVQLASIIGREFSSDLLLSLTGIKGNISEPLAALEHQGFIEKISSSGGDRYRFLHHMMREVAYHSLLRHDRRRYHRLVGEAIEARHKKDLSGQMGFLAYHFYYARNWPKAMAYTLEAAQQARQTYSCHEALTCYDRAIDILKKDRSEDNQEKALQLYKWKGGMHFCLGQMDAARSAFQRMHTEANRLGDHDAEAESLFRLGWVSFYGHQPGVAIRHLSNAISLCENENLPEIRLKAVSFKGFVYSVTGRLKEARPLVIQALDMSDDTTSLEGRLWSLSYVTQYYNWTGEFDAALDLIKEVGNLNKKLKSPYFHILLHFRQGLIYGALGRTDDAKSVLEKGLERLDVGDDRFWRPRFLNTLGWVMAEEGNLKEALRLNKASLDEAKETGNPETIHNAAINVGENHLRLGNLEDARKVLDETWKEVKRPGISYNRWRYKTRLLIALGELYGRLGEKEKGLYFVRKALTIANKTGAKKHQARALLVKGRLMAQNSPGLARRYLEKALAIATEIGTVLLIERIEQAMGHEIDIAAKRRKMRKK